MACVYPVANQRFSWPVATTGPAVTIVYWTAPAVIGEFPYESNLLNLARWIALYGTCERLIKTEPWAAAFANISASFAQATADAVYPRVLDSTEFDDLVTTGHHPAVAPGAPGITGLIGTLCFPAAALVPFAAIYLCPSVRAVIENIRNQRTRRSCGCN